MPTHEIGINPILRALDILIGYFKNNPINIKHW